MRKTAAGTRAVAGGDNERTARKATVFEEVLTRFEARLARLDAKAAQEERAENIALHAHAGSQNRHSQGKRDSR